MQAENVRGLIHDLNSPLTALKVALEKIPLVVNKQAVQLAELATEQIQMVLSSYSEQTNGELNLNQIYTLMIEIGMMLQTDNIVVKFPANQKPVSFNHSKYDMFRILLNIINNAQQAVNSDGTVECGVNVLKSKIEIYIKDNGSGINKMQLPYVYDCGFTKGKEKGQGYGLAIDKMLVKRNGGEISIESQQCRGTTVTLTYKTIS